jgi:hypothetical protein
MERMLGKTQLEDLETHDCHVEGCNVECMFGILMCPNHWAMVPDEIVVRAKKHLAAYAADSQRGALRRWQRAACAAIDAVNAKIA